MTAYTAIPDSDIDPESPVTTGLVAKLRNNPIAIAEGAGGAPKISIDVGGLKALATATTDTSTVLRPDGSGGVAFSSPGAAGFVVTADHHTGSDITTGVWRIDLHAYQGIEGWAVGTCWLSGNAILYQSTIWNTNSTTTADVNGIDTGLFVLSGSGASRTLTWDIVIFFGAGSNTYRVIGVRI